MRDMAFITSFKEITMSEKTDKIKGQNKITDTEVLKKSGIQNMQMVLCIVAQLRWMYFGVGIHEEQHLKKVFYRLTGWNAHSR